jgi:hypothetical protein
LFQLRVVEVSLVHYAGFGSLLVAKEQDFRHDFKFASSRPFGNIPIVPVFELYEFCFAAVVY